MSEEKETLQTLKEMANLCLVHNRISEIHLENLKVYPFVAFDSLQSVEINYDFSKPEASPDLVKYNPSVVYRLRFEPEKTPAIGTDMEPKVKWIEQAVRTLFFCKDLSVEIYFGNNRIFKSKENGRQ